jgi:hypothetical protein
MSSGAKTDFYREMFRLQSHYLHQRLSREPWWGLDYAFGNFTTLKAMAKHAPGPRMDLDEIPWRQTLADCWAALQQHATPADREKFVDFLWERFGARWLAAYPVFEQSLRQHTYFGCFRYDFHADTRSVYLHFQNNDEPHSPFTDPEKRREDLRRIIADIEKSALEPATVHFESWMNNLPIVLALFPPAFSKNLQPAEEFPKGYGWWGQFITKEGLLNPRRAELLKKEARFEFKRLNGHCAWKEFRSHAVTK